MSQWIGILILILEIDRNDTTSVHRIDENEDNKNKNKKKYKEKKREFRLIDGDHCRKSIKFFKKIFRPREFLEKKF